MNWKWNSRQGLGALLALLLVTGCGAPAVPPVPPAATPIPATATPVPPPPTPTLEPVQAAVEMVKGFAAAWDPVDPDKLLTYYAENVKSYDAEAYGWIFEHATIDNVLHHQFTNGQFAVQIFSFFVSEDARFAAAVGTFAAKDSTGSLVPRPYVSILEIEDGKFIEIFDYYGGVLSETYPLQGIPESANMPASDQAVNQNRDAVMSWETAYNSKAAQEFLAFYAEGAEVNLVIAPEWNVLAKDALAEFVTDRFSRDTFQSTLKDFFISPDGRFAAVQGTYDDEGVSEKPMVILLELQDGKIIRQYDYLAVDGL